MVRPYRCSDMKCEFQATTQITARTFSARRVVLLLKNTAPRCSPMLLTDAINLLLLQSNHESPVNQLNFEVPNFTVFLF